LVVTGTPVIMFSFIEGHDPFNHISCSHVSLADL